MLENFTNSKGPISTLKTRVKDKREGCSWSFSLGGWLKANFDGAAKGNPRKARASGIIRNVYGKGITNFTTSLGIQTNHYVKGIVAYQTINLAKEIGVKFLWLEGDSKNIIDCLNGRNKATWTITNIIVECI